MMRKTSVCPRVILRIPSKSVTPKASRRPRVSAELTDATRSTGLKSSLLRGFNRHLSYVFLIGWTCSLTGCDPRSAGRFHFVLADPDSRSSANQSNLGFVFGQRQLSQDTGAEIVMPAGDSVCEDADSMRSQCQWCWSESLASSVKCVAFAEKPMLPDGRKLGS